ncbi:sialidase family protein [Aneurinibacillus aneurinilyticus]|uniref:BNR/Asp-box repeat protein n=1 Tax=Aneurinibacillus aneurinilyticus ATCC 12856 TaxID=649747 RepID=U1WD31_ANEAE|nr:sialidase family protein [Aneurinibacillus aneurinilyticus]ERI06454.1 BNR/Asp-box repeat protein [Aneurinibacillus aneurinilyticus ATCC 12856]MED0707069.1 sialidase family protein [Aneurinibacillus aneurinilyticus]MED0732862.1 sialidase family protein [Aneurinibacillus aneurinilyticus]MED0740368.1 sialidase family protein [Aneurinibacillus aneurinilyticus]
MPDLTPNLNLELPKDNETADIGVINSNMVIIDGKVAHTVSKEEFNLHKSDSIIHHTHANKVQLDKITEDTNGELLYNGKKPGVDVNAVYTLQREVANLKAVSELKDRVDGASGFFYDLFDDRNGGSIAKMDNTRTNTTAELSIGSTTLPVLSVAGFAVGQEITVFDDTNLERPRIAAINGSTLIITSTLTKSYKKGAMVCRSSVVVDTINHTLKFSGWAYPEKIIRSAVRISDTGVFAISNNRPQRLSNGWLVVTVNRGGAGQGVIYCYKSEDNGLTWSQLCYFHGSYPTYSWAGYPSTTSYGTKVSVFFTDLNTRHYSVTFDATTVTNSDLTNKAVLVHTNANMTYNRSSIIWAPDGVLHAAWSTKDTNTYNILYSKSTDGGATWAKATQVTTANDEGFEYIEPCIVLLENKPIIFHIRNITSGSGANIVYMSEFNAGSWSLKSIYGSTIQLYPQKKSTVITDEINKIYIAWHGTDTTHTSTDYIRFSKSVDGGATWSAVQKLVPGQDASITKNKAGKLFIEYVEAGSIKRIESIDDGINWSSPITVSTGSDQAFVNTLADSSIDFDDPLSIYIVDRIPVFKGTWTTQISTPVLVEDVRYNIVPSTQIDEVVAWVDRGTNEELLISSAVSFHDIGGNESYVAATKTSAPMDETITEDQFIATNSVAKQQATLRLTLNRTSVDVDKSVKKLLGAVS